jgi:hypothetical protein
MPFDLADKPAADLPPRPRDLVQSAQQRAKHAVVLVRRLRTRRSDPRPSATPAADAETPEFDASSPDRPDRQCRASVTASRSPNPQGPRLKFSSRVASTDRIRLPLTAQPPGRGLRESVPPATPATFMSAPYTEIPSGGGSACGHVSPVDVACAQRADRSCCSAAALACVGTGMARSGAGRRLATLGPDAFCAARQHRVVTALRCPVLRG